MGNVCKLQSWTPAPACSDHGPGHTTPSVLLGGRQEEPALVRDMQHHTTLHLVTILDAVMGSTRPNSCRVRAHALTDWRLKSAP